jgi:ATP-dependent Lon protease
MSGEITLRGRVLPIGGIKEKSLAAQRAGIYKVILPSRNKKDIEEVPRPIRRKMNFIFCETMDEVLDVALTEKLGLSHDPPEAEDSDGGGGR